MENKFIALLRELENSPDFREKFAKSNSLPEAFNLAKPYLNNVTFEEFNEFKNQVSYLSTKITNLSELRNLDEDELDSIVGGAGFKDIINYFNQPKKIAALVMASFITAGVGGYGAYKYFDSKNSNESAITTTVNADPKDRDPYGSASTSESNPKKSEEKTKPAEIFGQKVDNHINKNEAISIWNSGIKTINQYASEFTEKLNQLINEFNAIQNGNQISQLYSLKDKVNNLSQENQNKNDAFKKDFQEIINRLQDTDQKTQLQEKLISITNELTQQQNDNINKLNQLFPHTERKIKLNAIHNECHQSTVDINSQPLEKATQMAPDYIKKLDELHARYNALVSQMDEDEINHLKKSLTFTTKSFTSEEITYNFPNDFLPMINYLKEWVSRKTNDSARNLEIKNYTTNDGYNHYDYSYTYVIRD